MTDQARCFLDAIFKFCIVLIIVLFFLFVCLSFVLVGNIAFNKDCISLEAQGNFFPNIAKQFTYHKIGHVPLLSSRRPGYL